MCVLNIVSSSICIIWALRALMSAWWMYIIIMWQATPVWTRSRSTFKNSVVSLYDHLASQVGGGGGGFQIPLLRIICQPWFLWNSQLSNTFKFLAENASFPNFSKKKYLFSQAFPDFTLKTDSGSMYIRILGLVHQDKTCFLISGVFWRKTFFKFSFFDPLDKRHFGRHLITLICINFEYFPTMHWRKWTPIRETFHGHAPKFYVQCILIMNYFYHISVLQWTFLCNNNQTFHSVLCSVVFCWSTWISYMLFYNHTHFIFVCA